jgi:hypothetical protein
MYCDIEKRAAVQRLRLTRHRLPRVAYGWKLQSIPDEAILRFARALARQAAREDHERDQVAFNHLWISIRHRFRS